MYDWYINLKIIINCVGTRSGGGKNNMGKSPTKDGRRMRKNIIHYTHYGRTSYGRLSKKVAGRMTRLGICGWR